MVKDVELYTGEEIYRPFWEKDSALLEVELGCSWHKCAFCDFSRDQFHIFSLQEIEEKVKLLVPYAQGRTRLFLLGENPFVMNTQKLLSILEYVHLYLPWIEEVSMYARFDDILRKNGQELQVLRKHGICHLHIGLESGNEEVLLKMNKGVTVQQGNEACCMLQRAGITYSFTAIPGLGGAELSDAHARDTAAFINATNPARVWLMGLKVWENTPLYEMCEKGEFHPLSLEARLQEVIKIVENLESFEGIFADTTVMDKYTIMGSFPKDKEQVLKLLRQCATLN